MTKSGSAIESRPPETRAILRSLRNLEEYTISASDGEIGRIHDFLFEDDSWRVRYAVVNTGYWLPGRKVLISARALLGFDWQAQSIPVNLACEQITSSPDIDTSKPVSRQRELELHLHYGWECYWPAGGLIPSLPAPPRAPVLPPPPSAPTDVPLLRSVREIIGYRIEASDGGIGCVDDLIVDDETWRIRYLVVATHKWLPGRKVLISPPWLDGPISWSSHTVKIGMSRENIRNSPEFDPTAPVNGGWQPGVCDYYGRPRYGL